MRRPEPKHLLLVFFGLILLIAENQGWLKPTNQPIVPEQSTALVSNQTVEEVPNEVKGQLTGFYEVIEIYDGDTIAVDMNGALEKIRMIGVDTPETHDPRKPVQCFGLAAADFTNKLIANNPVRLEADPLSTNRDRYQRLLRYVYLPDERLVQAEIIKQGYGFAYLSFPFEKSTEFKAYEDEARQAGRGLWKECKTKTDSKGHISTQY